MTQTPTKQIGKRAVARLRAIRRQAAAWRRRTQRALTLALIVTCGIDMPSRAFAQQVGQSAMAPAGGVVNRAVAGFQDLNTNGPGLFYYGINAADRGLGYNGSYMTFGGFVPYAEDDLGGAWSADLRSHLSGYGGFFSNVGIVRKQFIGGALSGIGVYWDYDGDANQYPVSGVCGTGQFGQFGHTYQQVGISGEFLTDFGNLRSNGYIPVGSTAYTAGNPSSPFFQNYVMHQIGLDAALAGVDLEVGAYIPGLTDWGGMISVGGYTFGNARYNYPGGKDVVPYFGGVYTRLDMTFIENWDFSLQYNNDSFFDSTGFARLTYRMGGSRRRNVPDQMEQPMMRNEHIVRAHQTPEVAANPLTGQAWNVIHVDNSKATSGTGTDVSPVKTLAEASALATQAWDIVFVQQGLSRTTTPYGGTFAFGPENQYLIGNGADYLLPSDCGGFINLNNNPGVTPLLSNPAGASIVAVGPGAAGATIANLAITGSLVGIQASGAMTIAAKDMTVSDVQITGNGTSIGQRGVWLTTATGKATFANTAISNMTQGGFVVQGGAPNVEYQGSITSDTAFNGGAANPLIYIENTTGGGIQLAVGGAPSGSTVANAISDTGGTGIQIINNNSTSTIDIGNVSLTNNASTAISLLNDNSTVNIVAGSGSGINKNTAGAAVSVDGGAPKLNYSGPIINTQAAGGANSFLLSVVDTTGGAVLLDSPPGTPFTDTGNGIAISNAQGDVTVLGAQIASSGPQGILINNSSTGAFKFSDVSISGASAFGVEILNSTGAVTFTNLNISLAGSGAAGFLANTAGDITATGANNIATASTIDPAVSITNAGILTMQVGTVSSGVTNGSGTAMIFSGTTSGTFDVTGVFTVGGAPGTTADVTNGSAATVTLPP